MKCAAIFLILLSSSVFASAPVDKPLPDSIPLEIQFPISRYE
jgi:hypothetical protein